MYIFITIALILNMKIVSVTPRIVSIQEGDPDVWELGSLAYFNSLYSITINEEYLNSQKLCSGKCDLIGRTKRNQSSDSNYPNECHGTLKYCWLHEASQKRQAADFLLSFYRTFINENGISTRMQKRINKADYALSHAGNICKCLCERTYNPNFATPRGELLDSICFDSVSVDDGYVATGVRFKRYDNRIHLELLQGILTNGTINPSTLQWKTTKKCKDQKKVIYDFKNGHYNGLKFILEDIILPNNAVVTGVALRKAVIGRHITKSGNIDYHYMKIIQRTNCHERTSDLVHVSPVLVSTTSLVGKNVELSKSCKHHIKFGGTSEKYDNIQHIVPFVDLQEIVTDPPEPINGIGWYYRGMPGYGGFLALKIFKNSF
ncbi:uncharacterized protein LOC130672880 [Microplitis mediator]|uniref:uncharacterized protein LOC130672880 n=1 Tax=Microplitis mediator TaxID=375433 RepID=UPI0025527597|nr:uncharacterized protein LOC130672880 [Microplitis mediator]